MLVDLASREDPRGPYRPVWVRTAGCLSHKRPQARELERPAVALAASVIAAHRLHSLFPCPASRRLPAPKSTSASISRTTGPRSSPVPAGLAARAPSARTRASYRSGQARPGSRAKIRKPQACAGSTTAADLRGTGHACPQSCLVGGRSSCRYVPTEGRRGLIVAICLVLAGCVTDKPLPPVAAAAATVAVRRPLRLGRKCATG
jgi:hypothetical protein